MNDPINPSVASPAVSTANVATPKQERRERRDRMNALSQTYGERFSVSRLRHIAVRGFRVILPLVGVGVIAVLFLYPQLHKQVEAVSFEDAALEGDVGRVQMSLPHYQSFDQNNRPYEVRAYKAVRDEARPDAVTLDNPRAKLEIEPGDLLQIEAAAGDYDQEKGQLNLSGDVYFKDPKGYVMETQNMDVDLKTGNAASQSPVQGVGPSGSFSAQGLIIEEKGNKVILDGKSKVILQ